MLKHQLIKRRRSAQLSPADIMTIAIHFYQTHYRTFKHDYLFHVQPHLRPYFPRLVSYERFAAQMKSVIVPLCLFLQTLKGEQTGIYFVDSLLLKTCHIKREKQHRVFREIAKKSKSSVGWFVGFKLHLAMNDKGELMAFKLTAGHVDDRVPAADLMQTLIGKLFGDKGYIGMATVK